MWAAAGEHTSKGIRACSSGQMEAITSRKAEEVGAGRGQQQCGQGMRTSQPTA